MEPERILNMLIYIKSGINKLLESFKEIPPDYQYQININMSKFHPFGPSMEENSNTLDIAIAKIKEEIERRRG